MTMIQQFKVYAIKDKVTINSLLEIIDADANMRKSQSDVTFLVFSKSSGES